MKKKPPKTLERALYYYKKRKYQLSISECERNISKTTDDIDSYLLLATIYIKQNELSKAKITLDLASKISPNSPEIYNSLGVIQILENDLENSQLFVSKAIELDPKNWKAHYNQGVIYTRQKRKFQALQSFIISFSYHISIETIISLVNAIISISPLFSILVFIFCFILPISSKNPLSLILTFIITIPFFYSCISCIKKKDVNKAILFGFFSFLIPYWHLYAIFH